MTVATVTGRVPLSAVPDPDDPRLALEWVDKLGQTVRPGDLVTYKGHKEVLIASLVVIRLLKKNHRPFSHLKPQAVLQVVDPVTLDPKVNLTGLPWTFSIRNPEWECIRLEIVR